MHPSESYVNYLLIQALHIIDWHMSYTVTHSNPAHYRLAYVLYSDSLVFKVNSSQLYSTQLNSTQLNLGNRDDQGSQFQTE